MRFLSLIFKTLFLLLHFTRNQTNQISKLRERSGLSRGKANGKCRLHGQDEPDICQTIPAIDIGGRHFREQNNIVVLKYVTEHIRKSFINIWMFERHVLCTPFHGYTGNLPSQQKDTFAKPSRNSFYTASASPV